ncbi:MAG: hypothetical protein A3B11_00630 [Candidatus Taylorbacteria bacterium RIFCSPLOWO2_01_FULL_44_26]|uniref:Uncharacterized protein n=2 Tax=Candidatus Tayloriibacteriota TaxID=1817919 RepID=A0A1G2MLE6_9BACT|nr:MAG: hypothetical protein A3D50_00545 [Candidatus Taylorbacteria bacterium RIFCSPHIGHO2_02_FULL_44_12]OHA31190.1 MAG: hypothetical protein A3B11_00630 [Candidatus Taylorbacteria bacterium RIFCSPLOWO2_01_FULL_44_26]
MTRTKSRPIQEVEIDRSEDITKDLDPLPLGKLDPETELEEESDELSSEEISLDEEELNPFGDKWEQ